MGRVGDSVSLVFARVDSGSSGLCRIRFPKDTGVWTGSWCWCWWYTCTLEGLGGFCVSAWNIWNIVELLIIFRYQTATTQGMQGQTAPFLGVDPCWPECCFTPEQQATLRVSIFLFQVLCSQAGQLRSTAPDVVFASFLFLQLSVSFCLLGLSRSTYAYAFLHLTRRTGPISSQSRWKTTEASLLQSVVISKEWGSESSRGRQSASASEFSDRPRRFCDVACDSSHLRGLPCNLISSHVSYQADAGPAR